MECKRKHWLIVIPLLALILLNNGCWLYSFRGTLPPHIKTIAIPLFNDRTAEFNLQQVVTDRIRLGFIKEGLLKVVEEDDANSVLYGTILSIKDSPLVYEETPKGEAVKEYRLTLQVEVEWFDKVYNRTFFKRQFTGFSEYDPTGATEATREKALQNAIDQIIEDVINTILADW